MKKTLFFLLALLMVGSGFAQKAPQTKLISSTENRIVVNFQLNGFSTDRVATPQGEQLIVNVPKMAAMLEAGAPDLPMFPIPTIIGDQAEMTVNIIDAQYTDYTNMSIAPSKGNLSRQVNPEDVPFTYGAMYQENAFWPATQAYLEKPYILRDFRGQNIMVRPFAFNPVTKTLRVYESLTIEMTKISDNGENQKAARKSNTIKIDPEQKAQYSRRFINFAKDGAKYTFDEDFGEMLIICTDAYMNNLQPLVDWKNQSGRPTTMVSLSSAGGNNIESLKTYVSNYYNDPAHNLEYLLLVGEYNDITPKNYGYGQGGTVYSDNYLGKLEGNDDYIEVLVGRLSVSNAADADVQVNKIIYFERDVLADATWCGKGMGIGYYGAGSGHYGEDDYQHIDFIRDTLLHYTYTEITEHHGGSGGDASVSTISGTTNTGIGIINYCNHGDWDSWGVAGYSVSNVMALTNNGMLPVVWSVACLNGKFDNGTCFAESWLRANQNGNPTGAVGGMFSFVSQPWIPPMYGHDEMVDILTEWHSADQFNHTFGGASLNGSMDIIDRYPSDAYQTFNAWLLFGDPSMIMRTATPTAMDVTTSPSVLMIGMTSLEVSAENTAYGIATLSNEEGVIASAEIVDGVANLTFEDLSTVETLSLTVVGFNKVTEIVDLEVLPAQGAYISVNDFTPGNVPVAQEQLMSMTFKNVGADPTTGTTNIVLSSTDENITFSDNEASFGVLAANETITLTNEFAFTVASGVADGTKIQIDVTMTCGSETWTGKARITVGAPIVEFDSFQCVGGFTPGEAQNVVARFKNIGHYMATGAVVTVSTQHPNVTFSEETVTIGTIDAEGNGTALFNVIIDENCPENDVIDLTFDLTADNGVTATGQGTLKNSCNIVFNLADSYGDGWNGASLNVAYDGTTQNLTVSSGNSAATYTLEIGIGTEVSLTWQSGSWDQECSFTISYEGGDDILVGPQGSAPSVLPFSFTVNCSSEPIVGTIEPVSNLEYVIDSLGNALVLNWEAPEGAINFIITRGGVQIGSTTESTFTDAEPIEYTEYCVVAQFMNGDSEPVCTEEIGEVWSVNENDGNIRIYPNPVKNTLYIQGLNAEYSYILYNGMGQMVASGTANGTQQIDCSGMTKGIYFLHLTAGAQTMVEKVVVK